jgi:hypothetical protein
MTEIELMLQQRSTIDMLNAEVTRLTAELAARTEEKDALAAALEIADECIDTIRLNPDDAFSYADQYVNGGELDKPTAILASRDAKVRAKLLGELIEKANVALNNWQECGGVKTGALEMFRNDLVRLAAEEAGEGRNG